MLRCPALVMAVWVLPTVAIAQEVIDNSEHLKSNRPEAWAMNYFSSVTLLSGLAVPRPRAPGSLEVGAEAGWIPTLSLGERFVGFNGTKEEALNHSTVFARPRVVLGLPWQVALTLSYVPPVEIAGVTPHLFAMAVERSLVSTGPWSLGGRVFGQVGRAKGAFTCSADVAARPPGSAGNPYGCDEPSSDRTRQRAFGVELIGSVRVDTLRGLTPWVAISGEFLDNETHVRAQTFGLPDRSVLDASTLVFSGSAGVAWPISDRLRLSVGLHYTPIEVRRRAGAPEENDALFNARASLSWQLW